MRIRAIAAAAVVTAATAVLLPLTAHADISEDASWEAVATYDDADMCEAGGASDYPDDATMCASDEEDGTADLYMYVGE